MKKDKYLAGIGNMKDEFISEAAESFVWCASKDVKKRKIKPIILIAAVLGVIIITAGTVVAINVYEPWSRGPNPISGNVHFENGMHYYNGGIEIECMSGVSQEKANSLAETDSFDSFKKAAEYLEVDILTNKMIENSYKEDVSVEFFIPSWESDIRSFTLKNHTSSNDPNVTHVTVSMGLTVDKMKSQSYAAFENMIKYTSKKSKLETVINYKRVATDNGNPGHYQSYILFVCNGIRYDIYLNFDGSIENEKIVIKYTKKLIDNFR